MPARLTAALAALAVAVVATVALAPAAHAQDRVYWTVNGGPGDGLSFAALDGSGGGALSFSIPQTGAFDGLTVDSAAGRFYWAALNKIESLAFDGSDQRTFDSGGALTRSVFSLSIDPDGRRLIWTQGNSARIEVARLDGGGGGPLATPGITIGGALGAVFDPPTQRIYWTDPKFMAPSPLNFAAIDGSGGVNLPVAGPAGESGLAIDHADGRIYWIAGKGIRSANLDGSDSAPVATGVATVAEPQGLAIDEATQTIYWGNRNAHALSFAKLDGSESGQVNIAGGLPGSPNQLVLLVAPRNVAPPQVTPGAVPGELTCSPGEWAPDQPQANLFDAVSSLAYGWTRDGVPIPGAGGATLAVPAAGASYGCTVTASNVAGATTVASAPFAVPLPATAAPGSSETPRPRLVGFGAATAVTLAPARGPVRGGAVRVTIENFNSFAVSGNLTASPVARRSRRARIGAEPFAVGAGSSAMVLLRLPPRLWKQLVTDGKLKLRLTATVVDQLGTQREVVTSVVARAKHRKPKRDPQVDGPKT